MTSTPGDQVSVTVTVDVEPAVAFEVFTNEIDLWWRRGIKYRVSGRKPGTLAPEMERASERSRVVIEPRVGGRLFEQYEGPGGPAVHVAGKVTAWEPPSHLAFEWRGANFAEGEVTYVDVKFTPSDSGTQVALVHRGFAALRPDHPVRHGQETAAFIRMFGMWWGELMSSLRERAADR